MPTDEIVSTRSDLCVVVPVVRSFVIVLSQSCDVTGENPNERIIVAPAVADDTDRFAERYADAIEDKSESLVKSYVATTRKGASGVEPAKALAELGKPRQQALEQLWLGRVIGAFPLAADVAIGLQRSICYFDHAVSLPASWRPFLLKHRAHSLKPEWASVLQDSAARWIGRYAFPYSNDERLAVGGLATPQPTVPPPQEPTSAVAK